MPGLLVIYEGILAPMIGASQILERRPHQESEQSETRSLLITQAV